ncbi:MAG: hypothetical protein HYZ48_02235 [Chlamydiales bacterium]|nr:hypothetical protein [Chlamydiales bacterium]
MRYLFLLATGLSLCFYLHADSPSDSTKNLSQILLCSSENSEKCAPGSSPIWIDPLLADGKHLLALQGYLGQFLGGPLTLENIEIWPG